MECLITLDDAVAALHAQLNAPSRRFTALISSWYIPGAHELPKAAKER